MVPASAAMALPLKERACSLEAQRNAAVPPVLSAAFGQACDETPNRGGLGPQYGAKAAGGAKLKDPPGCSRRAGGKRHWSVRLPTGGGVDQKPLGRKSCPGRGTFGDKGTRQASQETCRKSAMW